MNRFSIGNCLLLLLVYGCTLPEYPVESPVLDTGVAVDVTLTSARFEGTVVTSGTGLTETGHCWSTVNEVPEIESNEGFTRTDYTTSGKMIASELTNLQAGKTYYVRAYGTYEGGTCYGPPATFRTTALQAPTVTTGAKSEETLNSAKVAGALVNGGNTPIQQYGHCWSAGNNTPTISDSRTQLGTGIGPGNFESLLTNLSPNTTYYVRAYATNSGGTGYGNVVVVQTRSMVVPTVRIQDYTSGPFSIRVSAQLDANGDASVTETGFVYSTSNENPSVLDQRVRLGGANAPQSFQTEMTGLTANTAYYVRAYAISSAGIGYSATAKIFTKPLESPVLTRPTAERISVINGAPFVRATSSFSTMGNDAVIEYGFVWSHTLTTPELNKGDSRSLSFPIASLAGDGIFRGSLSASVGYDVSSHAYIRSWARTASGAIVYSTILAF